MINPKPLSEMELVELERLVDKASPGPRFWQQDRSAIVTAQLTILRNAQWWNGNDADAELMALNPDTIRRLISMARK